MEVKNLNIPLAVERHEDLEIIKEYYSRISGTRLSKSQAVSRLLYETANVIRNTGNLWSEGGNSTDFGA